MTIDVLKPRVIRPEPIVTPQCSEIIPAIGYHDTWRKQRYSELRPHMDPKRCQHTSTVEIEGKGYCSKHAGRIALDRWLKGDLVERTTTNM